MTVEVYENAYGILSDATKKEQNCAYLYFEVATAPPDDGYPRFVWQRLVRRRHRQEGPGAACVVAFATRPLGADVHGDTTRRPDVSFSILPALRKKKKKLLFSGVYHLLKKIK